MSEEADKTVGTNKRKRGPVGHVPTAEQREKVRLWSMVGTKQEVIAAELGITVDTLAKHYREELDEATARGVANIATNLYTKAMSGDVTSMIFYLKTRGRWSEKAAVGDKDNPLVIEHNPKADEIAEALARQLRDAARGKDVL